MNKKQRVFIKTHIKFEPDDIPEAVLKPWWTELEKESKLMNGNVQINNAKLRLISAMMEHGEKYRTLWRDSESD